MLSYLTKGSTEKRCRVNAIPFRSMPEQIVLNVILSYVESILHPLHLRASNYKALRHLITFEVKHQRYQQEYKANTSGFLCKSVSLASCYRRPISRQIE